MKTKGVTLVELLVVIVVLGIISGFSAILAGQIFRNLKLADINNELNIIEDAAAYYTFDVGERPYGTMSGTGTCALWNQDSYEVFYEGTRDGNPIPGWSGPYVENWADETPLGGCYVYRSYQVGSQNWARGNWYRFSDDTVLGDFAPIDKDIEIIMIRFYPLNDSEAIAESHEVANFLMDYINEEQILYVRNQAVIGYYILPRD
jgi:prepilin-type N-terminal cleavage/methylation domain-containing protein